MEKNKENIILGILQNGFERAAFSFSGIILNRVTVSGTVIQGNDFSITEDQGELFVLTTQLMGDHVQYIGTEFPDKLGTNFFSTVNVKRSFCKNHLL